MRGERQRDLVADPVERIEGRHRLLEDHRELRAAIIVELVGRQPDELLAAILTEPSAQPFEARRPITDIMVWLLPEPDSPTIATVSPAATSRSMPFTAWSDAVAGAEADVEAADRRKRMATGQVGRDRGRRSGYTARGAVARRAEEVDGDVDEGRGEPLVPAEPGRLRAGPARTLPRRPGMCRNSTRHRRRERGEIGRVAEVAAGILGEAAGDAGAPQPRQRRRRRRRG